MTLSLPMHFLYLQLLLLILGCTTWPSVEGSKHVMCNEREALALVDFKESFAPPYVVGEKMFSWNILEEKDCCAWKGITCNNLTGYVISLDLSIEFLRSNQLRPSLLELQHLRRLDLSWNALVMKIPEFIASLSKLNYLDLSNSNFVGKVPPHLGNLSSLHTLVLNSQDNGLSIDSFQWLARLSSLERLDMSYVDSSGARDWLSTISMLPLLSSFNCSLCSLPIVVGNRHVTNPSTSLKVIDLSYNILSSSITSWLIHSSRNLLELHLSYMNSSYGPPPDLFQNMVSLITLKLSGNHLEQGTLESLANLCNLKELDVSQCGLNQSLTYILLTSTSCNGSSLETLHLGSNNLKGTFPRIIKFPSLRRLNVSSNHLDSFSPNESKLLLPELQTLDMSFNEFTSLARIARHLPTSLTNLYLSSNSFYDIISDTHVSSFTKLRALDLSYNPNLTVNFSKPPFQLEYIGLRSCRLGPDFPNWLLTQKSFSWLDISESTISGPIPVMFWENLSSSLRYLNLSFNNFHDTIPNLEFPFAFDSTTVVDLSSNTFYGPIPFFLFISKDLLLPNNHFSSFAPLPFSSKTSITPQSSYTSLNDGTFVDLSNNLLSGTFPHWLWIFKSNALAFSVANNRLSGTIPSSIGSLSHVFILALSNNNFSGEIPLSLKNCTKLRVLDLSHNQLSGPIPNWIGQNLLNLSTLLLSSNNLSGNLPSTLCHLTSLRILDLSNNELSGIIPSCVYNLTTMASDGDFVVRIALLLKRYPLVTLHVQAFFVHVLFNWKGKDRTFANNLPLVKTMDLSNNHLSGEIPVEITSLVKLHSLNLSCNNIRGTIPAKMGKMTFLESLNLARNNLYGEIPSSLAQITSLSDMDVSHNNLSGRIPIGTQLQSFGSSAYVGNLNLCGVPLQVKCTGDTGSVPQPSLTKAEDQNKWDMQSFYSALGSGFAFGLLVVLGAVTFFQFASDCVNSILAAVLSRTKTGL